MGASVTAYWPGITEEQLESQPGFYNDDKAWGDWMAEREESPEVLCAIKKLKAEAILTYTTDGLTDEEVQWVSPAQLRDAVKKIRKAVETRQSEARIILETYARNANGLGPITEEYMRDLDDVEAIANWAEQEGADKMTLEVNW